MLEIDGATSPYQDNETENIERGLELLRWFDGIILLNATYPLLEKASKKFGLPEWELTADHVYTVREELRKILS